MKTEHEVRMNEDWNEHDRWMCVVKLCMKLNERKDSEEITVRL